MIDHPFSPELAHISTEFLKVAEQKMKDPGFEQRFLKNVDKKDAFMSMVFIFGLAAARRRMLGGEAETDPFYAETVIGVTDKLASDFMKFCSPDEIKSMFPENTFRGKIVEGFEACDALTLSKICAL